MTRKFIIKTALVFLTFLLAAIVQKPIFMAVHGALATDPFGLSDYFSVLWHGLAMDAAVAAYFTIVPLILAILEMCGVGHRFVRGAETVWYLFSAMVISLIFVLDMGLYPSWGFRLDMSPLFYFTTSPAAAIASVTPLQWVMAIIGFLTGSTLIFCVFRFGAMKIGIPPFGQASARQRTIVSAAVIVAATALFLAIRGGVTVSTMNLSRSYYSSNTFLNHSAVNPFFSFLYSATHQQNFDKQFRFMSEEEASETFAALHRSLTQPRGATDSILTTATPDIYIVILESFSAELFPSLGGQAVARRLDSVAQTGLSFTNIYANSFRTDRGIPAVLSAFPGAPTASVMKFAEKTASLPGIARTLADNGWQTSYYYGGDINFTNMLAYLINTGFGRVTRDTDFPIGERTGKWGAHDHLVFGRCLSDAAAMPGNAPPQLRVIQTSSSHEPFKVPYRGTFDDERMNAFAYTDSCTADFLDRLGEANSRPWLAILVPDHYGAWPRNLTDPLRRHHIPLIFTGSALRRKADIVTTTGSQCDIAATLLSMLGIAAPEFTFSTDLLDPEAPHFAFFSEPGFMGLVNDENAVIYNIDSDSSVYTSVADDAGAAPPDSLLLRAAKAYLQTIYNKLSEL